jgi:hypothetical protein
MTISRLPVRAGALDERKEPMKTVLFLGFLATAACVADMALGQTPTLAPPRALEQSAALAQSPTLAQPPILERPPVAVPDAVASERPAGNLAGEVHARPGPYQEGNCNGSAAPVERRAGPVKRFQDYYYGGCPWKSDCGCCCPVPLGVRVHSLLTAQVANGRAAEMILFHYDFCDPRSLEGAELNIHGRKRLTGMAAQLWCNPVPIVIEASPCEAGLDAARRNSVVALLQQLVPGASESMVVVGDAPTRGLSGQEAVRVYDNMLKATVKSGQESASGPMNAPAGILFGSGQSGQPSQGGGY